MAIRVRTARRAAVGLVPFGALIYGSGCGTEQFLGLEDYQRDLLVGGLAGALLAQQTPNQSTPDDDGAGRPGTAPDGLNCWDLNGNLVNDPTEDQNQDGIFDARDCQGPPGPQGPPGRSGADGLDGAYGRDGLSCWDLNGNGIGDPAEDRNRDGRIDVADCHGPAGAAGPSGPPGPPGQDAPEFFDIFIDDLFTTEPTDEQNGLQIVAVAIDEPVLGTAEDSIAFRFAVPETYDPAHDVTMRFFLYRTGVRSGECFVFAVDGRRLRNGSDIQAYDQTPSPPMVCHAEPSSPGCGRRWVRLDADETTADVLLVVTLPLNNLLARGGLAYPRDLEDGDLLAFELRTVRSDGRAYQLLGVEVMESATASIPLAGATVFQSAETVACAFADCNQNGIDDDVEIQECPLDDARCQDCDRNGTPDECDLCDEELNHLLFGPSRRVAPFAFLQDGFTQELYATAPEFMGGLAFAPDGDLWVDRCPGTRFGSALRRFDAQQTELIHETSVHPLITEVLSNAGCGLTNHTNGSLYSNTSLGVTQLDADTGMQIGGPFGRKGNSLGIAPDPMSSNVIYVAADGTLYAADAALTVLEILSTAVSGKFVDGIAFDPSGEFLFVANRTDQALTVVRRDGSLVQHVPVADEAGSHEPDGVAVHIGGQPFQGRTEASVQNQSNTAGPAFVVTTNLDGTVTRFDFPDDDYTRVPTRSVFAAGGFRGDLVQVGPDSCLYVTQNMTRFADGTVTDDHSVVRICSGFYPPVAPHVNLSPETAFNGVGTDHTVAASAVTKDGTPLVGIDVFFDVLPGGPHEGVSGVQTTDETGTATFTYSGTASLGRDRIQARFEAAAGLQYSNIVTKTWLPVDCSLDCNDNGIPDDCDIESGLSADCQSDGIPDECGGGCK